MTSNLCKPLLHKLLVQTHLFEHRRVALSSSTGLPNRNIHAITGFVQQPAGLSVRRAGAAAHALFEFAAARISLEKKMPQEMRHRRVSRVFQGSLVPIPRKHRIVKHFDHAAVLHMEHDVDGGAEHEPDCLDIKDASGF